VAAELDKVLDGSGPRQPAIARAAAALRLSTRQVYNLVTRYRADRTVTALLPHTAKTRQKRLDAKIEKFISVTLREQWLTLEAPPLAPVVAEIQARCEEAGLKPPSYVTIARRVPALFTPEEIARKRSANPKHLLRLKPRPAISTRCILSTSAKSIIRRPTSISWRSSTAAGCSSAALISRSSPT